MSSTVGIELELIETESSVGSFNVDIYAQEAGTGRKVIIENQLEDTNHDHLGKIITYAAGKGAQVVIWIVRHARDEHRQAIEWLNAHTDDEAAFFPVEIEVWSIGDSLPAPRFNVVEQPNEWARRQSERRHVRDRQDQARLLDEIPRGGRGDARVHEGVQPQEAGEESLVHLSCESSAYHMALLIDTKGGRTGIEFYVPDDKEIGHRVIANVTIFEQRLGLKAKVFDATKASGIRLYKTGRAVRTQ